MGKIDSTRLLLTILTVISGIGTTIGFNACNELKELNKNMVAVSINSEMHDRFLKKLDTRMIQAEDRIFTNTLTNHDKISLLTNRLSLLERLCKKWKTPEDYPPYLRRSPY